MYKTSKKVLMLLIACLMCFSIVGCNDTTKGNTKHLFEDEKFPETMNKEFLVKTEADYKYDEADRGKQAEYLSQRLKLVFNRPSSDTDFPWKLTYFQQGDYSNSFLWDYGAMHSMTNAIYHANPNSEYARSQVIESSNTLEAYYSNQLFNKTRYLDEVLWKNDVPGNMFSNEFVALAREIMQVKEIIVTENNIDYTFGEAPVRIYTSGVGGGDPYYDDNVWIVMSLLEAGVALDNATYIENAEKAMMYVLSGWTAKAGGGILWKESNPTKNTCSNGPAAMASILFYDYYKSLKDNSTDEMQNAMYTKKMTFYLEFAKYIYEWTKNILMDPIDGVYEDHITLTDDGYTLNRGKLTYNAGTMLSAAARLYGRTGEQKYYDDALKTVQGSYQYFVTRDALYAKDLDMYPTSDSWFTVYLVQGYIDVAVNMGIDGYVKKMRATMDYAYQNARDYYGLIKNDMSGRDVSIDAKYFNLVLRNSAAPIEMIALLDAYFDKAA